MITKYETICFLCGRPKQHVHHLVFGRGMRALADEDGLTAPVCNSCHEYIHKNGRAADMSRMIGQLEFEKTGTREEFRKRYGRSYL